MFIIMKLVTYFVAIVILWRLVHDRNNFLLLPRASFFIPSTSTTNRLHSLYRYIVYTFSPRFQPWFNDKNVCFGSRNIISTHEWLNVTSFLPERAQIVSSGNFRIANLMCKQLFINNRLNNCYCKHLLLNEIAHLWHREAIVHETAFMWYRFGGEFPMLGVRRCFWQHCSVFGSENEKKKSHTIRENVGSGRELMQQVKIGCLFIVFTMYTQKLCRRRCCYKLWEATQSNKSFSSIPDSSY